MNEQPFLVCRGLDLMVQHKRDYFLLYWMTRRLQYTTRGLLATDHVILNHGQVTWTTPELAPLLLTTTPHQREDVSALDRFNVHRCPTQLVFSGTGLELVTRQATVRYPYHLATAATTLVRHRDEVFKSYVCLLTGTVGPDFILIENNARHKELIWWMDTWKVRILAE
ncbi:uncharacterized protein TNCV_2099371 [Trichonephila clavipes]|nr:uncharacterized protein TNCV_2099371 [Trichonephila clavipes]